MGFSYYGGGTTDPESVLIYDIQYTADQGEYCYQSTLEGQTVTTTGIVTAVETVNPNSN